MAAKTALMVSFCGGLMLSCGGSSAEQTISERVAPPPPPIDTATVQARKTELSREVFSYRGSGRNPFVSLIQSGEVRPLVEDLRVTSITYDPRYPATSVAVLRDTSASGNNQAYSVRVGDELGRMRVAEIQPGQVVVIVSEFGTERQVVLRQRARKQEGMP
ncbi:MAG: hypothetical protein ACE5HT_05090 [Gemmatimonadales bacterium]